MRVWRHGRKCRLPLFAGIGLAVMALAAILVIVRDSRSSTTAPAATRSLNLPFTLPCAIDSNDSSRVFSALRRRDKNSLMSMLADRRFMMVHQGTRVVLSNRGNAGAVRITDATRKRVCYVPAEMVSAIVREAGK